MKGEKKQVKKNKGLYVIALCGVLAVSGAVYAGTRGKDNTEQEKDLVDLNEEPVKEPTSVPEPEKQAENDDGLAGELTADTGNQNKGDTPVPTQPPVQVPNNNSSTVQKPEEQEKGNETELTAENERNNAADSNDTSDEEDTASVMNPTADDLKFSEEEGLCWPVEGNVIKNYSVNKMVYFETLQQFRTNPAIFISGEVGTEVVASADGIVLEVRKEDKTGQTLVLDIGSGYRLVYGHLTDITVKEGDYLEAGKAFAKLAPVTKYYQLEGNHLYFQVFRDEETVNPMLLIR